MGGTKSEDSVAIDRELISIILEGARNLYPKELIMLLRGKKRGNEIRITDLLVPPLANYGRGFAEVRLHALPLDFSVLGTVHSHPSGNLGPSSTDLNHFIGRILMITGYPFGSCENIAVYKRSGERIALNISEA